ncbi:hypothetical protein MSG28_006017 [Choristoneura fumiferana]|uniref:Uncharacterized protein n=1 Tax=Choristoneura fumiferana TaxID=7141 RepID=A0ACC0L134_CHOFU|nr:hypothetical protein MSG28_006017 [Choristoneura fumiferana]
MDNNLPYAVRVMGIMCLVAIILFFLICLCRGLCEKCFDREINRIYPEDIVIHNMGATEQPLPSYEEVTRPASAVTTRQLQRRRRNHRHDKLTSDHVNNNEKVDTNTQLDGDSTEESTIGDGDNDNESSGIRNIGNDSVWWYTAAYTAGASTEKQPEKAMDITSQISIEVTAITTSVTGLTDGRLLILLTSTLMTDISMVQQRAIKDIVMIVEQIINIVITNAILDVLSLQNEKLRNETGCQTLRCEKAVPGPTVDFLQLINDDDDDDEVVWILCI